MLWWSEEIPTLQHGLLTLRRPHLSDAEPMYRACQDPEIPRFTNIPREFTLDHAIELVTKTDYSMKTQSELPFTIEFDGAVVGMASLHTIDVKNHCADIGYWISKEARGKKIATQVVDLITEYGLNTIGFKRIQALVDIDNTYSRSLLLSLGYKLEGILNARITRDDGSQVGMALFSKSF